MVLKFSMPRLSIWTALAAGAIVFGSAFPALAGAPLDLSAYKGKVVYLDFWASWCHPCEQSFPYMEQLKSRYGSDGLVIVAVNVDHSRDRADSFLKRVGSDLKVVYDADGKLAQRFRVSDMPTSLLIGRDGRVRYTHKGFHPEQTTAYNDQLVELLDEK
ncbi:TlpA disulfide reductase family protein [Asticcacaulis sp. EMRT-3]|uniref:TlpA disulfide reductase family protein n=1 Tax=Asticcacaulis sp. EMRT-3 TaxID=3040349 RepID=UPI0024AF512C|nr:TlpA disulfide reductase family protein [Asticcacaulis sp. EMRT-3]MDI7776265.1 TlpA disulfide reductase family protein [Asticcacaulis sp. EMRT-3]